MERAAETVTKEHTEEEAIVGRHVRRLDSEKKVDGTVEYTDDRDFDGYYVELVRSNVAHGEIASIETGAARERPGVVAVVTGDQLRRAEWVDPYIGPAFRDQPLLAIDKVRYVGEPVAAVVAETEQIAEAAAGEIRTEIDRLEAVPDVESARRADAPRLHADQDASAVFDDLKSISASGEPNEIYTYEYEAGDLEDGFDEADAVLEDTYSTPMIQHAHLEPFVTVAEYDTETEAFTVVTGNQTPHFVEQEIARIFDLPTSKVDVDVPQMGGSYGAKTYARMEPLTAALSRAVEAPVKLRQTSSESFDTAVRDGTETRVKTGVTDEGDIVAQEVEVVWDSGAYADISPRKAKKAGYTAVGAYDIDNVSITSSSTYTNKPPGVAYRGFGVAQTAWAVESHLDEIAAELDIDPYQLRANNVVQNGGTYNGSPIGEHGVPECLSAVADEVDWLDSTVSQPDADNLVRGRGMAVTLKATITPSTAEAIVLMDKDGSVSVLTGATKVGQGVQTTLAQIASEELGIPMDRIDITDPNTEVAPFNTSTTSSRTTFHVGNAMIDAIDDIRSQIASFAAEELENGTDPDAFEVDGNTVTGPDGYERSVEEVIESRFPGGGGTVIGRGYYTTEKSSDDGKSDYQSAFWMSGATVAEVTVDTRTGSYSVDKWVNATDAGNAIDPERVRGQIRGAAVQGLGHVMSEEMDFEGGQQVNKSMLDYKVPVFEDAPDEATTIIVESADEEGPYGAKGVGEANTVTVPPAIGNAIADAAGARVTSLPVKPEKVLTAIDNRNEGDNE